VESLAMVAEIVHGAPYRFQDPARFSLAHGGKDRQPFPVPIGVYDETIRVMKSAVQKAKLGRQEELTALKRLDIEARKLTVACLFVGSEIDRSQYLTADPVLERVCRMPISAAELIIVSRRLH
jgi:hypothetical protein